MKRLGEGGLGREAWCTNRRLPSRLRQSGSPQLWGEEWRSREWSLGNGFPFLSLLPLARSVDGGKRPVWQVSGAKY